MTYSLSNAMRIQNITPNAMCRQEKPLRLRTNSIRDGRDVDGSFSARTQTTRISNALAGVYKKGPQ